jgi:hypothetical protein
MMFVPRPRVVLDEYRQSAAILFGSQAQLVSNADELARGPLTARAPEQGSLGANRHRQNVNHAFCRKCSTWPRLRAAGFGQIIVMRPRRTSTVPKYS